MLYYIELDVESVINVCCLICYIYDTNYSLQFKRSTLDVVTIDVHYILYICCNDILK